MKIPSIHVGCGKFSLQRLEMLINGNEFNPIACVDIDLEKAKAGDRFDGENLKALHNPGLPLGMLLMSIEPKLCAASSISIRL